MNTRYIFISFLAGITALVSCQEKVDRHEDLRAPKQLTVQETQFNVGWEKTTVTVNYDANCYWGLEFLAWTEKVVEEGDTTLVLSSAKWMNTPVLYGTGSNAAEVTIEANSRSRKSRSGYIKVFTGDENVCHMVKVTQAGNPDYVGPVVTTPKDLVFDFTQNAMGWPTTAQSVGDVTYPLDGEEYGFVFGRCNMAAYLVIHNAGAYLGLPALDGYRLTKVTVLVSSNNSKVRGAKITSDPEGVNVVSAEQSWPASPSVEIVYDIDDAQYDTMYYLVCTVAGLPVAGLTLHYEP